MLDGAEGVAPPEAWLLSRICEEFSCTPAEALEQDFMLCLEILELRAYAKAKAAVENAKSEDDATEWQKEAVFGVVKELMDRNQATKTLDKVAKSMHAAGVRR